MEDMQPAKNSKPQQENQKGPTRIPVSRIWLREMIDLPGNSITEQIICSPQSAPGRQFFVAHFVPAYQLIELECWKNEKTEPYRTRIPLAFIRRFD